MNAEFWVPLATVLVALAALLISSASAVKARVKTIEDAYITRYWQIPDRFPADALVAKDGTGCVGEDLKAVRLYLRLCEDELELRQLGWVGRKTWQRKEHRAEAVESDGESFGGKLRVAKLEAGI